MGFSRGHEFQQDSDHPSRNPYESVFDVQFNQVVSRPKGITRRSLLTSPGASAAGMLLSEHSLFADQSSNVTTTTSGNISASFASLKQIDAGLLNVGYADVGTPKGFPEIGRAHV